ncbi:MetQ/NlpA family ABC transporter substrate-binding protein [Dialister micraerophilus]|uniref:Lipoprotein n=1 Tax=Dialister micraerophilus UPII 345-E TaxID=910314 RepID=E4L7M8_9FIRM|nr:MetQ/NlpA family ABC transporter substrate-binding protein [Dialister micraerophilus]EFR43212.1 lipoprotein, YaeC family [Dialister micraerophilus UPII 345-E]
MNLKKTVIAGIVALSAVGLLAGCSSDSATKSESNEVTLKVGASPVPHAQILNHIKDKLAKEGVKLEVVEFNDFVQPNLALEDKSIDANFFQHLPYLEKFNEERGTHVVSIGNIHIEPMGIYSSKIKDLKNLSDGSRVLIPSDPTNGGRALLLLQSAGLIKLRDGVPITATVQDIVKNPKNLQFSELEAPQVPRSIDDADIAVINMNFAIQANISPSSALFTEGADSPYANILSVRKGDENRPEIQKLLKALQSDDVKEFLKSEYNGSIVPAF